MNYRKTSPVGIDVVIDQIQKKIYDPLVAKWGSLDLYGRVYSNVKVNDDEEEFILERYIGDGDYEPVLFSEGNKIFFIQGNSVDLNFGNANNDLWAVAIVNIDDDGIAHRADEEAHVDLISALNDTIKSSEILEVQYGIENLRRITNEAFDDSNFRFADMHPNHVFMVRMSVTYKMIEFNC